MSQNSPTVGATDTRIADLVQTGRIRVGLFPCFMVTKAPLSGELRGVAIEIGRALGARLDLPVEFTQYPSPPEVIKELNGGGCDVAFLGIDNTRSADVEFSRPLMQADLTFMVPPDSPVRTVSDADLPGTTIGVVSSHIMDFALRGKLQQAERVYADTPDAAFALLTSQRVKVLAGIRPGLIDYAARFPGSRVLDDRYAVNTIALAAAKARSDWLSFLSDFSEAVKTNGLMKQAIEHAGLRGVQVPT